MDQFLKQMNTNGVEEYVQKTMSSMFSGSMPDFFKDQDVLQSFAPNGSSSSSSKLETKVFETFDDCIVQVTVPDRSLLRQLKVFHTPYQCILEWFDGEPQREEIRLPSSVRRKGTTAVYRNGTLEIKMPKHSHMPISEIDVHDHD
jgi:HSP20 family molecular chaperone IbpA